MRSQGLINDFKIYAYIEALRPRQWTKNLVVFAAPLFAFNINYSSFLGSLLAFILFCATSSSFYLLNDIVDVQSDRQHPIKRKRPIAAGLVSIPTALAMSIVLLVSSIIIGWLQTSALGATIIAYAILQVAYNIRLKHTPIADIGAIAAGFVLRAYSGAAASNIVLSSWFVICTAMLALFLAIEKRKAELRLTQIKGHKPRKVLRRYSLPLLHRMENVVTTGCVVTYTLWSSGPVVNGASTSWMLITLPFVLYGIFRYQLLSDSEEIERRSKNTEEQGGSSERPEEILLKDKPILFTVLSWAITCFVILYLEHQGLIF
ncbi:UbiA prenyltransferase [Stanieria sp. NIES-3757]|nr:UbiA prenyltransferase [Stanieria sp. NIES-3757]